MKSATGPIEALSAVTLVTRDMAAAVTFYERLGFSLLYGGGASTFSSFRIGDGYLNLQLDERWVPPPVVWGRVIFHVDDVDAMFTRATDAGARTEGSPADAPWGERYFHVRDPDGHQLSFARPLAAP